MQNAYLPLFVFLISCSTLVHAEPALICGGPKPPCALGTATICGGPKPPCELFTGTIISCGFLPDLDFNCSAAADAVVNFSDKDPSEGHNATGKPYDLLLYIQLMFYI